MMQRRFVSFSLLMFLFLSLGSNAQAFRSEYSVTVKDTTAHLFHVKADFWEIKQAQLDVQLPVWSPGWYTIENYAKNVIRFIVLGEHGDTLRHPMIHKSCWRIDTRNQHHISIEFDYLANQMALNQAILTPEFGFFQGTELFLEPIGHRDGEIMLHVFAPANWPVVSPLKHFTDDTTYGANLDVIASNYDELVDAPCEMGQFDVTTFKVDNLPHQLIVSPKGAYSQSEYDAFVTKLQAIASDEKGVFGELPYKNYDYFYFFRPNDTHARGGLEHLNSHVALVPNKPDSLIREVGLAAHEFFHCWNVKRLRPIEMWPYDYSHENYTPMLWFSEGFTNYYGLICEYRAKLIDDTTFLKSLGGAISGVETNPASHYTSPDDASTSTWNGYDMPQAFGISYYGQGEVIASVLDIMILQATKGTARLDNVMRELYTNCYKRGKGLTPIDFLSAMKKISGKDFSKFYTDYISGPSPTDPDVFHGVGLRYTNGRLEEDPNATREQKELRKKWLTQ